MTAVIDMQRDIKDFGMLPVKATICANDNTLVHVEFNDGRTEIWSKNSMTAVAYQNT